ncbi:hypothetical protein NUU61_002886 [Penicillium alfredii]|uniref:RRM domain-containing protein n=1 Tax=Penicillium alfredii TaxID=1506179 RepID=A0A9W9KGC2_9EURO|nr:uncharacterized protein NUU61_002886 [Penicillium alfredii]KAJ5105539.1 hypothetical protein NUU61_002886 [Penicillium alfredii]
MPDKQPVSFDQIIQSDRQKKKHEQLASQLLGKNRRSSAPGSSAASKPQAAKPGSLASRIGVAKVRTGPCMRLRICACDTLNQRPLTTRDVQRSASASFKPNQKNPAPATAPSTRPRNKNTNKRPHAERLLSALSSNSDQATVRGSGGGLSIKGASGPFIVVGSNFASGTTAADIQSALEPVSGPMIGCRVVSHHPTVTAEFEFADKWTAENVVANFHNQRADGRVLSMKLKPAGSNASNNNFFSQHREQADRQRRNRRANPEGQDGRFGFGIQNDLLRNGKQGQPSGLYSDQMMVDAPQKPQNRKRR